MFITAPWKDYRSRTIHEELITTMTNMLRRQSSIIVFITRNKLMLCLSFFLKIVVKSMVQHLINTQKYVLQFKLQAPNLEIRTHKLCSRYRPMYCSTDILVCLSTVQFILIK